MTDELPQEKEYRLYSIRNLYAFDLFCQHRFEDSLNIFTQLGTGLYLILIYILVTPRGAGVPPSAFAPPLFIHFLIFCSLLPLPFFLFSFTYFLLLSIRSLSTRIVPLRFQARGRRRRPNLGLVCLIYDCVICIA